MTPLIWVGVAALTALAAKKATQSAAAGGVHGGTANLPQGPTGFVVVPGRAYQMILGITLGVDPRANLAAARDAVVAVLTSHGMAPHRIEPHSPLPVPNTFAWRVEGQFLGPQPVELVSFPGLFFLFAREAPPAMLPPSPPAPAPSQHAAVPSGPPQHAASSQASTSVPAPASPAPASPANADDALSNARKRVLGSIFAKDAGTATSPAPAPQATEENGLAHDAGLAHGARTTQDARNRMMAEREAQVILGENGIAPPAHTADAPNGVAKPGPAPKAKGSAGTPSKGAGS